MTGRPAGALVLLDDAAEAVGRLGPATGLLWITALPSRFLLAFLLSRLIELGPKSTSYGEYFTHLAYLFLAAWLFSLWGRQAFVRACRGALQDGGAQPPLAWTRIPPAELASYLLAALAVEALFWGLLLTAVAPVALLVVAGLLAAVPARPGELLASPLRGLAEGSGSLRTLFRLLLVFGLLLLFAGLNLHLFLQAGLWVAAGTAAVDLSAWSTVLSPFNPLYQILLITGACLLLEPFWLAALTSHVERTRARKSGDDLRRWFAGLEAGK